MQLLSILVLASQIAAANTGRRVIAAPTSAQPADMLTLRARFKPLQLDLPCGVLESRFASKCPAALSRPWASPSPAVSLELDPEFSLPLMAPRMSGTLGGYANFNVMQALHLSSGPLVSWLTPDSPREDLPRLRVVAPGWGIRYSWNAVSVGATACTRFMMVGENWPVIDMLTSEARFELLLP